MLVGLFQTHCTAMFPPSPTPAKPVRLAADVERPIADRIDALAARYQVPRAVLLRHMVHQALEAQS